jgi:hypothetical protein
LRAQSTENTNQHQHSHYLRGKRKVSGLVKVQMRGQASHAARRARRAVEQVGAQHWSV